MIPDSTKLVLIDDTGAKTEVVFEFEDKELMKGSFSVSGPLTGSVKRWIRTPNGYSLPFMPWAEAGPYPEYFNWVFEATNYHAKEDKRIVEIIEFTPPVLPEFPMRPGEVL